MNLRMFRKMLKTYVDGKVYIWNESGNKRLGEYDSIKKFILANILEFDKREMVCADLHFEAEDEIEKIPENIPQIIDSLTLDICVGDAIEDIDKIYTLDEASSFFEQSLFCDMDVEPYRILSMAQYMAEKYGKGMECRYADEKVSSIYIRVGSLGNFAYIMKNDFGEAFEDLVELLAFELSPL